MIIDWRGYNDGAISADTAGLQVVKRNGSTYAVNREAGKPATVYDVHPLVYAYGAEDDTIVRHEPGAYPIRWALDPSEIANLIDLGD